MEWVLWLDDVRVPYVGSRLVELEKFKHTNFPTEITMTEWCKSTQEAIAKTARFGRPTFMYLDHDLGGEDTSMDYLKWIANIYEAKPPEYTIISANPIGAKNIQAFMNSWKKVAESP